MYTSTSDTTASNEVGRWQAWTRADFTECVLKLWNFLPQDGMNAKSLGKFKMKHDKFTLGVVDC